MSPVWSQPSRTASAVRPDPAHRAPVAAHHRRRAAADLAGLAGGLLAAVVVEDPDGRAGDRQPDRAGLLAPGRVGRDQRGRLGQPVALPDGHRRDPALDLLGRPRGQRGGPAAQVHERGQVVALERLPRAARGSSRARPRSSAERCSAISSRKAVGSNQRSSTVDRPLGRVHRRHRQQQPVGVRQRQRHQRAARRRRRRRPSGPRRPRSAGWRATASRPSRARWSRPCRAARRGRRRRAARSPPARPARARSAARPRPRASVLITFRTCRRPPPPRGPCRRTPAW